MVPRGPDTTTGIVKLTVGTYAEHSYDFYVSGASYLNSDLTVNGTITASSLGGGANPIWCAGRVESDGTKASSKGLSSYTVSNGATGLYDITFGTAHTEGADYILTCTSSEYTCFHDTASATSTTARIYIRNSSGNSVNASFSFVVLT